MKGLLGIADDSPRHIAAIGMFDGVHQGHRGLIEHLKREGESRGLTPMVVTFADHPLRIVDPTRAPELLTSPRLKVEMLKNTGVGQCVVLDFNEKMRHTPARQFLEHIKKHFGIATLVVGFNHSLGHDRVSGTDAYKRIGEEIGMEIIQAPEYRDVRKSVSSSIIRDYIQCGKLDEANRALGAPFTIAGRVVEGNKIGRTIGFPTANVEPEEPHQLFPLPGVYAAVVTTSDGTRHNAMVNVGYRPTVDRIAASDSGEAPRIEANLLDFLGYLYGERVEVSFMKHIRKEKKFASIDKLKSAIAADELKIRQFFDNH